MKTVTILTIIAASIASPVMALTTADDLANMALSRTTGGEVFSEGGQGETLQPHPYCLDLYRTNPHLRSDDMNGILICSQRQWNAKRQLGR